MSLFDKFKIIKEGIEKPLGSKEDYKAEMANIDESTQALEKERISLKPSYWYKEAKQTSLGFGNRLSDSHEPKEEPWKGKTTKDPFKDYERLYPEFLIADPDYADAFTEFTFRRLVHARYGPEKSVELIKNMQKRLREQGKI